MVKNFSWWLCRVSVSFRLRLLNSLCAFVSPLIFILILCLFFFILGPLFIDPNTSVFLFFFVAFIVAYILLFEKIEKKVREVGLRIDSLMALKEKQTRLQKVRKLKLYVLIEKVRNFNPSAEADQKRVLEEFYTDSYFAYVDFDTTVEEKEVIEKLKNELEDVKRDFLQILVKLAVTDDGIKNNEWFFLLRLLSQLGYRTRYVDMFKKRYEGLRTESDYKYRYTSSSSVSSVEQLSAYFAELGLPVTASKVQVREAYHQLAMLHHPDLPKNRLRKEECEEMMKKINRAYNTLIA